jgi:protein-disulfide isomerase
MNWQWHHLPLSVHEPATTREARLAECAGETGGHVAFWQAVTWIYQHTRSDGQGLPTDVQYPYKSAALQTCLDSARPDALIRAEADEAAHDDIAVTPTLRLLDHQTGQSLVLHGPVDGDAVLSAIDLLAARAGDAEPMESEKRPVTVH